MTVSGAATDDRAIQSTSKFRTNFFKLFLALVAEEMRRLRVLDGRLDEADVVRNVTVGGEDVEQTIKIVVEEETRKRQRLRRHLADARRRRFICEQTGAVVVIQRDALIREVADHDALLA